MTGTPAGAGAPAPADGSRAAVRDGMRIEWDVPIPMDDVVVLRADVFRPVDGAPVPVILSHGPYAKGLAFQEGYADQWRIMAREHPDVRRGSSNRYELSVELWPTCVVLPAGYRIALTIRGTDYRYDGPGGGARLGSFKNETTGCGPFLHDDPTDRPPARFGGTTTLHAGPGRPAHVLLPIIPS